MPFMRRRFRSWRGRPWWFWRAYADRHQRRAGAERLPLHSRIVFEGDSITAGSNGPTYVGFALIRSMGRYFAPSGYNQATGGQTAAQMATQVATITALEPKVVVLLAGTNDLSGTADTPAAIFANLRTCSEAYIAAGAEVINICVLPRNDGTWTGLSAGRQADRETLNDLIRAQAGVTVVDLEDEFDPTTMCSDGLHPNYVGAILIGNAVGDALAAKIATDDVIDGYDTSDNLLLAAENPLLSGTTGTRSGTPQPTGEAATGWTVTHNDGMTVACSKTTLNGRPAQRIQVSGTNSTNGRIVNFTNTVGYNGQAGEFYEMWWDFALAAGAENLNAISATTDTGAFPNATSSSIYPSDTVIAGVLRPPMTGSGLAGADVSMTIQGTMRFAAGTVAADIIWAAPYMRRVPDGQ